MSLVRDVKIMIGWASTGKRDRNISKQERQTLDKHMRQIDSGNMSLRGKAKELEKAFEELEESEREYEEDTNNK